MKERQKLKKTWQRKDEKGNAERQMAGSRLALLCCFRPFGAQQPDLTSYFCLIHFLLHKSLSSRRVRGRSAVFLKLASLSLIFAAPVPTVALIRFQRRRSFPSSRIHDRFRSTDVWWGNAYAVPSRKVLSSKIGISLLLFPPPPSIMWVWLADGREIIAEEAGVQHASNEVNIIKATKTMW